ncbi:hypothetical protein [Streptomyces sp. ME19-01-6]|uniref:hypothetical protein n=1 Tax=Streptomyces sp. ME19-01-6 TaxID=3028686 RepID=UPI0029BDA563|nr:hypothetical protein [Streptomyces sp. ME19-01-6]MDX3233948.1 hypothetical protein [Streptomyces sp. ME19-01-6]
MSGAMARAGRGRTAAVPDGFYEPPPTVEFPEDGGAPVVHFTGEDGRECVFRFEELPLAGMHRDFAHALGVRIGPGGGRRTQRAASGQWQTVKRFLLLLDQLPVPPQRVEELRVRHLERYLMSRRETCLETSARRSLQDLLRIVRVLPGQDRLDGAVVDYAGQPGHGVNAQQAVRPGYSDREFQAIMTAARSDVAAIRDRIAAGEDLLRRFLCTPDELSAAEREQGVRLEAMARTGRVQVDYRGLALGEYPSACYAQARQLFVVDQDLAPLLIYAAGLSGRNPETLKELPAAHRLLEERAVAVTLIKRRRGKTNSRTTVHWSVDPERQLRTMGSFYLLLHRMMARSRAFSGTASVWSIWAGNGRGGIHHAATSGHTGPFDAELARKLNLGQWAERHGLGGDDGEPLQMMLTRMKKTAETRTAKQVGGHLPSARLTNTAETSFAHYLRADPFITEWAADVLTEAINDAERHAHQVVVRLGGADAEAISPRSLGQAEAGELDTLAASCLDIERSPDGGRCRQSFLACFACPNALVLERHLPALLALADALREDLERRDVDRWAARHGATWTVLTRDILPRFSPAQRAAAARARPALPLDLLDGPKELA